MQSLSAGGGNPMGWILLIIIIVLVLVVAAFIGVDIDLSDLFPF
jgi:hypothetical protein